MLAGGSGTRFWPLSTAGQPKQLLPLIGDDPLLVETVRRLHPFVPCERTIVITSQRLREVTRRLLPDLPEDNVLGEPRAASHPPSGGR